MELVNLPIEIIRLIQTYISKRDYNYFLNASKERFSQLKKELVYFVFSVSKSEEYLTNLNFREILLSKVKNGWKQISLRTSDEPIQIPIDLPMHEVNADWMYYQLTNFTHIECVRGVTYKGTSIPPMPTVKELRLLRCNALTDVTNLSHLSQLELVCVPLLSDFSPLRNISRLTLDLCNALRDCSVLNEPSQRFYNIYDTSQFKDFRMFSDIRYLTLQSCGQLEDVSPLKGIHHLRINRWSKVIDISGLGLHHRLMIEFCCYSLVGFDALLGISHVQLWECNIEDVSVLRYATTVSLLRCYEIVDVSPLSGLRSLSLTNCDRVLNIDVLRMIPDLTLIYEKEMPTLNQLVNKRLTFAYYNHSFSFQIKPDYFRFLKNIQELSIFACDILIQRINEGDVEYFQHLQSLTICNSHILKSVKGLGSIPTLRILDIVRIFGISAD